MARKWVKIVTLGYSVSGYAFSWWCTFRLRDQLSHKCGLTGAHVSSAALPRSPNQLAGTPRSTIVSGRRPGLILSKVASRSFSDTFGPKRVEVQSPPSLSAHVLDTSCETSFISVGKYGPIRARR